MDLRTGEVTVTPEVLLDKRSVIATEPYHALLHARRIVLKAKIHCKHACTNDFLLEQLSHEYVTRLLRRRTGRQPNQPVCNQTLEIFCCVNVEEMHFIGYLPFRGVCHESHGVFS